LISPIFSLIKSRQSFFPAMIASRASLTHAGHSESVCRGKPSVGLVFSQDFSSGLSDHFGVTEGLYGIEGDACGLADCPIDAAEDLRAHAICHRLLPLTFKSDVPSTEVLVVLVGASTAPKAHV
jgi:hypothetical protein